MGRVGTFARERPILSGITLVAVALGAAAAWWLGSPLFISQRVDEAFPMTRAATIPSDMTRQQAEQQLMEASKLKTAVTEPMPPAAEPKALARGSFRDADGFHKGSGTATLFQLPDGQRVLRFEDFQVTNGPDLQVYLAEHPAPASRTDLEASGSLHLGKLKGNLGSQNYELPSGADPARFKSVVIYCQPFHVVFSTATFE